MDLRTIINSDSAGPQKPPAPSPRRASASTQEQDPFSPGSRPARSDAVSSPLLRPHRPQPDLHQQQQQQQRARPPQPPPLQPPHRSPRGSVAYGTAPSPPLPYQNTSAVSLSGGWTAGSGPAVHHHSPQESFSTTATPTTTAYPPHQQTGAAAAVLSSPFTPQPASAGTPQSYFSQPRSSIHSASTPTSARSYSSSYPPPPPPPPPPLIRRDSSSNSQPAVPPQPQSYSPTQQQQHSQPGTPILAPPLTPFPQQSPHSVGRPLSSDRDGQAPLPGSGTWAGQDNNHSSSSAFHRPDQRPTPSPVPQPALSRQDSYTLGSSFSPEQQQQQQQQPRATQSVSPRAAPTSLVNSPPDIGRNNSLMGPSAQHSGTGSGETSTTIGDTNHPPQRNPDSPSQNLPAPSTPTPRPRLSGGSPRTSTVSPRAKQPSRQATSPAESMSASAPPRKKRKRYAEPPIFAQRAPRTSGKPPEIPSRPCVAPPVSISRPPLPSKRSDGLDAKSRSSTPRRPPPPPPAPAPAAVAAAAAAPAPLAPMGHAQQPNGQSANDRAEGKESLLGPWEPSITGLIPHEELTKVICDFLFEQVVMRKDLGAGLAGAAAAGVGAILEVEAKLGQLIDRNRGGRLRLPVLTETVLSRADPSLNISFESSMSLAQHRALNNFLNDTVKASMAPGKRRIPITYAHKKERDTFYEIETSLLPPVVRSHLNRRHKPKVRVTTDQRTGAVLARIVKCRIADLDVYSPRTCLDWRISVNLEMQYDGDVSSLTPVSEMGPHGRRGDRNKDRMSYRHLAYQIDLTQVASTEGPVQDFEHELEVEISSAEVRRQGDLALAGDPNNQYEEVIKGFVDNIRVLARAVPPH
ncbi:hypothetical protein VTO42DRAFT_4974 [Malbranchea cinnamomea]